MTTYLNDVRAGWRSTQILLALRWRTVRSRGVRIAIMTAAAIFVFGVAMAANLGYVVQLASLQTDTAAGIFARVWVGYLSAGIMGALGSATVGSAVFIALFAPFTGSATMTLAPADDLAGVRPPRAHRYFDSLILNAISGLGLLQLLALTTVTSLLTLDGQHAAAILFTWVMWAALIALMTAIGWALEWVVRKYGKVRRRILGTTGLAIVTVILLADPDHGGTLFGLARLYTKVIRVGVTGWNLPATLALAGMTVTAAAIMALGVHLARVANRWPPAAASFQRARSYRGVGRTPFRISARLLLRTMWRTGEVRRPLISLIVVGMPILFFTPLTSTTETSITFAVPLTIALAWASNAFALIGPGMPWLASSPRALDRLPLAAAAIQLALSGGLLTLLVTASYLTGHADGPEAVHVLTSGLVATLMCIALSATLSIRRPIRARLAGRGDSLVPAGTSLLYMLLYIAAAGAPILAQTLASDDVTKTTAMVAAVALALAVTGWNLRSWNRPEVRAHVVLTVGGD
jgi:TM2 domain-containing membrane protein YozV